MNAAEFCAEKYYETVNGIRVFKTVTVIKFCELYTNIDFSILNDNQKLFLKERMINLSREYERGDGYKYNGVTKLDLLGF